MTTPPTSPEPTTPLPEPPTSPEASAPLPAPSPELPEPLPPTSSLPTAPQDRADGDESRRSGLRNPEAAVRGLGSGTLSLEAIVLLLAIQPIRILGGDLSDWGIGAVVALAVLAGVLAGSMRRPWAWHAGTVLQVLLLLSGLLHWSLAALGLIFGLTWVYATSVRRRILG